MFVLKHEFFVQQITFTNYCNVLFCIINYHIYYYMYKLFFKMYVLPIKQITVVCYSDRMYFVNIQLMILI